MNQRDSLSVVKSWLDAVNCCDVDRLIDLSDPDIEVGGPQGSGQGHQLLREWLERAGLTLRTVGAFVRDDVVVLAQHGLWRSVGTGEVQGRSDVASCFLIREGRVVRFVRYGTLNEALVAAGLDLSDEVADDGRP